MSSRPYKRFQDVMVDHRLFQLADSWLAGSSTEGKDARWLAGKAEGALFVEAKADNDQGALGQLTLLMAAINDLHLLSHVRLSANCEGWEISSGEEVDEAEYKAAMARARKAMEIFLKLPVSRTFRVKLSETSGCQRCLYSGSEQTLSGTKRRLLSEIANGWWRALDEGEADTCFDFIVWAQLHEKDKRIRLEVLESVVAAKFPIRRLEHIAARFGDELQTADREIFAVVVGGWLRNAKTEKTEVPRMVNFFVALENLTKSRAAIVRQ